MRIANRISRLGTETAFAVSMEVGTYAASGKKVYPFHIGDMNIKTPASIIDAAVRAAKDGCTGYCSNWGVTRLRDALAADVSASRGVRYSTRNVVIQPGGKPTIGKFILTLMNPGDEVLYPNPGYPIYESQIEFHGGKAVPYTFLEGRDNFTIDIDDLEKKITPKTKLLVLNDLQNPTGAECSREELGKIADLVQAHDLYVLCDEAYFDVRYAGKSRSLVRYPGMKERCVILQTFSKRFAMTGWRLGASIGPEEIIEVIGKLNVNDESCTNHFIQYGAIEALLGDQIESKKILQTLQERRDLAVYLLNDIEGVRCFKPDATFYLFPNVTEAMKRKGFDDYEAFRKDMLHKTGVAVCTRAHFGRPLTDETEYYIRFAYSGIDLPEIEEGLSKFKKYIEK